MDLIMKLEHCTGCSNDMYNDNNAEKPTKCFGFDSAELIQRKRVSNDQPPPWYQAPSLYPSCYIEKGYLFVSPEKIS